MSPQEQFIGFWRLRSFEQRSVNEVVYPFGPSPYGMIAYGSDGFMSVQLGGTPLPEFRSKTDSKPFDALEEPVYSGEAENSSFEELNQVFDGYLAYYGRFTIDTGTATVTHHVEGSNHPTFRSRALCRRYEFNGTLLTLSPPDSQAMSATLTWERLTA